MSLTFYDCSAALALPPAALLDAMQAKLRENTWLHIVRADDDVCRSLFWAVSQASSSTLGGVGGGLSRASSCGVPMDWVVKVEETQAASQETGRVMSTSLPVRSRVSHSPARKGGLVQPMVQGATLSAVRSSVGFSLCFCHMTLRSHSLDSART